MRKRIDFNKFIPKEFDYAGNFLAYDNIGSEKYQKTHPKNYCSNYSEWCERITMAYHTVNTKEDRKQLVWALQCHANYLQHEKDIYVSVLFALVTFFVGFAIPCFSQNVVANYIAAFVIAGILEVWLLILIIPRDNRIDFDNAAIQVLSNLE